MPKASNTDPCEMMSKHFKKYIGENFEDELRDSINDGLVVTLSGGICIGKSTVAKALSKLYGLENYSVGAEIRRMANEGGITTEQFVKELTADIGESLKVDVLISYDTQRIMSSSGRDEKGLVVEGMIAGWHGLSMERLGKTNIVRVCLDCKPDIRLERIAKRYDVPETEAAEILKREGYDKVRWKREFGIDTKDKSIYHLVVDNSYMSPEDVVNRIKVLIN